MEETLSRSVVNIMTRPPAPALPSVVHRGGAAADGGSAAYGGVAAYGGLAAYGGSSAVPAKERCSCPRVVVD